MPPVQEIDPGQARVSMLAPDGTRYLVPAGNIDAAIAKGWKAAPEEERQAGGALGPAAAFASGALSEGTFGYSDIALTDPAKAVALALRGGQILSNPVGEASDALARALGGAESGAPKIDIEKTAGDLSRLGITRDTGLRDDLAALAEQNPTSTLLGRVTGGVGGALVGPGASVARGAGMIGKGAAGAVVREGAEGVLSHAARRGAGLGVAGAIEGAAAGYGHVVSEEVLGDRELAAEEILAHIGGGALLGGAVGGALGAASPLASAATKKMLSAAKSTLDDIATKATLKSTGARPSDLRRLGSPEKMTQVADDIRAFESSGGKWKKILEGAPDDAAIAGRLSEAADEAIDKLSRVRSEVDDFAKSAGLRVDVDEFFRRVDDEVLGELDQGLTANSAKKARKVRKELAGLRKKIDDGGGASLRDLTRFRQELAKIAYPKPASGGLAQTPLHAQEVARTERVLERFIEDETSKILRATGKRPEKYAEARRLAESMIKGRELAEKAVRMDVGLRMFSLTDYIGGAGAGAIFGGPVGAVVGAVGNKLARERGPAQVAKLADKIGRLDILNRAAKETHSKIRDIIDTFVSRTATKGLASSELTSRGAVFGSAALLAETKFAPDGESPKDARHAARARAKELRELVSNPDMLADRIALQLRDAEGVAPNVAQAMATKGAQVATFLASKAPSPPARTLELPGQPEWLPSRSEAARFARYVRAATKPLSTLEDLRAGRLSREAVETLKTLYPKIYDQTRTQVIESLANNPRALGYSEKIHLSMLLDAPLDPTMRPEFIRSVQGSYADKPAPGRAGGGMRVQGLDNIGISDRMKTTNQRLAEEY